MDDMGEKLIERKYVVQEKREGVWTYVISWAEQSEAINFMSDCMILNPKIQYRIMIRTTTESQSC